MEAAAVTTLADQLRTRLDESAVPGRAEGEKRYLKSDLDHVGVPVPAMRRMARSFTREYPDLGRDEVIRLAEELWSRPVHEHRSLALLVLDAHVHLLVPDDMTLLERLLRQCHTWAHVDLLAPMVAGRLLLAHPEVEPVVRRWAADEEQWVRRGGLLSFLLGLRQETEFPRWFPVFGEVVDPLLTDNRFFVRKAIGWLLREGTKHHPESVVRWLADRLDRASGLTLREAVRRLPESDRTPLLAAHAALHPRLRH
ncbi:DNA alkylation repair protein [Streptomyces alkaliterrae]|uniref:DNA alkylation repair protein n=1 Tax=Streptomyces alkaliterrae TaxID=2213162 RepID=A0A5P0YWC9_9ACTN|nr:DNA alkylation repair protein [Streptomyces alkaliterrae]MBB1261758.1 DNA alkylation repair protein [Streptomyces alkaliterrae]MQS04593.1 DNA alkylation repair protein [Streptomyces alkaliterrae]